MRQRRTLQQCHHSLGQKRKYQSADVTILLDRCAVTKRHDGVEEVCDRKGNCLSAIPVIIIITLIPGCDKNHLQNNMVKSSVLSPMLVVPTAMLHHIHHSQV